MKEISKLETLIMQRKKPARGRKVRSAEEILAEILEVCRSPSLKHWIMIKANLGDETFSLHLDSLLRDGKVAVFPFEVNERNPKTYYAITEAGLAYLELLKRQKSLPREKIPSSSLF